MDKLKEEFCRGLKARASSGNDREEFWNILRRNTSFGQGNIWTRFDFILILWCEWRGALHSIPFGKLCWTTRGSRSGSSYAGKGRGGDIDEGWIAMKFQGEEAWVKSRNSLSDKLSERRASRARLEEDENLFIAPAFDKLLLIAHHPFTEAPRF